MPEVSQRARELHDPLAANVGARHGMSEVDCKLTLRSKETSSSPHFSGQILHFAEMLSHVQEDDDTHPTPVPDGFEYWSRTVKGKSFRQYLRRRRGAPADAETTILDVNLVSQEPFFAETAGWDAAQCDVHAVEACPSGGLLAYSVDGSGYETCSAPRLEPHAIPPPALLVWTFPTAID